MRWIVRLIALIGVMVLLIAGGIFLIPSDRIAAMAVAKFNDLTGRELTLEGSLRPTAWPILGVSTGRVSLSNADWAGEGPMFEAEGLDISVDLAALIAGEVKITEISARRPILVLERSKDGRENWVFGGASGGSVTTETPGVGADFSLDVARFAGGKLVFIDGAAGARFDLDQIDAEIRLPSLDGPADIQLSAQKDGQPFSATAQIPRFKDVIEGKLFGVTLTANTGGSAVAFDGTAGLTGPVAKGQFSVDAADKGAIFALIGGQAPDLPLGLGRDSLTVAGEVTLTETGSLHLRSGKIGLDQNAIAIEADLTQNGDRPKIIGRISTDNLVLNALAGGDEPASGDTAGPGNGWSGQPMDFSALGILDAELGIVAGAVDLGVIAVSDLETVITIDRARMVAEVSRAKAYGGTVAGSFVANARDGLSVRGDLDFLNMDLQALLRDFANVNRLKGQGDLTVQFLGSGNSMATLMNSLDGEGRLDLGRGEIMGLDLKEMVTRLDPSYVGQGASTVYDSLSASFVIKGGDLQNDDLKMNAPLLQVEGQGRLGLGHRDIDYRLRAIGLRAEDGSGGTAVPLLIKGPWSDPAITIDIEALAQERLAVEQAKLEEELRARAVALETEAKAKLEAELEKATGGVVQEGESLEDAAKRLGAESLDKEAQKLLEGLLTPGN